MIAKANKFQQNRKIKELQKVLIQNFYRPMIKVKHKRNIYPLG